MRAAVGEHAHGAVSVADEDHRFAPEPAGEPVPGLGDLRVVADEHPAAREDPRHLVGEDGGIDVEAAVYPIRANGSAVVYHRSAPWGR